MPFLSQIHGLVPFISLLYENVSTALAIVGISFKRRANKNFNKREKDVMNTLKSFKTCRIILFILILLPARVSFAQYHMELEPSLDIREEYDDNIFLSHANEKSDYVTRAMPKFDFNLLSQHTQLGLSYSPTFVWYARESDDVTRHTATLNFKHKPTEHFLFKFYDRYLYSDDPLEEEDIDTTRDTRDKYQRNWADVSFEYLYGYENGLVVGYEDTRLKNEDETQDDCRIRV